NLILQIGDKDIYVHGLQTYVITYNQRDVTKLFSDTNSDEFYWDVNGTGWYQPFDKVTARLHIGLNIINALTGDQACYSGASGSTNVSCVITRSGDVIASSATTLEIGENLTIAVGFKPQTFSEYRMSFVDYIKKYAVVISAVFGVLLLIAIYLLKLTKGKGAPGRGTIIAEYLPPKGVDVALSSVIRDKVSTWAAATYIDLAVRHKLKIIERNNDNSKKVGYSLEFINANGLTTSENAVMTALFGESPKSGAKYDLELKNADRTLMSKFTLIYEQAKLWADKNGYYIIMKKLKSIMTILVLLIVLQAIILGFMIDDATVIFFFGLVGVFVGVQIIRSTKPFSQKGRELFDYLKGLELYINIAEKDRLKVLQSPQGAEKSPIDVNNTTKLVRLYERVLPYAILFGSEKEWTKVLGKYYEQQESTPDWYVGNSVFNAVLFSSALSSFSTTATSNSYSSPTSSSSGGSFGGGFSGGGGGGGGGGGW
ncbi:MAG TPA: DUF2207 domain-containing protein, partial [Candidatus Angelobacter sp.]|nr:DUF2207 domain-containing protein [Candidatus Angelobacter sp.]